MTPSIQSRRILIVEDEAIIARDIWQQLIALGHEPLGPARSGEQGIELAGLLQPELVLMDIHLRGAMDGIAAAQAIRNRFDLPAIFLSAFSGEDSRAYAQLAEPAGFLSKPFTEEELKSTLEAAFIGVDARLS